MTTLTGHTGQALPPHLPCTILGHYPALLLLGNGVTNVRGVSFRQAALKDLLPDRRKKLLWYAWLTPEPTNAHDPNAIMVHIQQHHVGYIDGDLARSLVTELAPLIAMAPVACVARVYKPSNSDLTCVDLHGHWRHVDARLESPDVKPY